LIIIEYLDDHLQKEKGLKHSTVNTAMCSIFHFCVINDVLLNKTKISKFIPKDNEKQKHQQTETAEEKDRCYTRQEIERLLKECDKRFRVVILLLASGGLRIGAIPGIELRHLKEINYLQDFPKIYQLWVYPESNQHKYYTFLTHECTNAIDDYLEFRKEHGEKNVSINETNRSPLIREQFKLHDKRQAANPRKISLGAIEKTIERAINRAGLHTTHKVMMTHGFRKYAITEMINADVDYNAREYLVGHKHSRGLDVIYDRTSEKKRLAQWAKAINNLTIDSAYHSNKRLEIVEGEMNQKIAQQAQQIDKLWEGFRDMAKQAETDRNKTAKGVKHAMYLRHLLVKNGVWTESEAMDYLNKMMNDIDPVVKKST
jgi:integrase